MSMDCNLVEVRDPWERLRLGLKTAQVREHSKRGMPCRDTLELLSFMDRGNSKTMREADVPQGISYTV